MSDKKYYRSLSTNVRRAVKKVKKNNIHAIPLSKIKLSALRKKHLYKHYKKVNCRK